MIRKKLMKITGFTLIEILIVIGIIAMFSTFIFINYRKSQPTYALLGMAQKISFNLRRAQNMAMNANEFHGSVPRGGYGVYFSTTPSDGIYSYIIFADCDGSGSYTATGLPCNGNFSEKVEEIKLDAGVKSDLISIMCSPTSCTLPLPFSGYNVVFMPPDPVVSIGPVNPGDTAVGLSIILSLESGSTTRTININKAGKIDIE